MLERSVRLGYHDHNVVDGGKARIILTTFVTPAEVQDNQPAIDLLWRTRFRWKLHPRQVTGDTKYGTVYGTVATIVAIEREDIHADVPLSEVGYRSGQFRDTDVVYDPITDTFRCPGQETLRVISRCEQTRRRVYEAPTAACASCVFQTQCTTGRRGRRIHRSFDESCLDRVRGYHASENDARALRKRKVWIEPLFAEAKEWHGLRRFRLRGVEKVNIQAQLIAAGQNLKRLLSKHGWGRRPWPKWGDRSRAPTKPGSPIRTTTTGTAVVRVIPAESSTASISPFSTVEDAPGRAPAAQENGVGCPSGLVTPHFQTRQGPFCDKAEGAPLGDHRSLRRLRQGRPFR